MRFLVFQHIAIEHPGIFRDFLAEDGIQWDAVELDAGEAIPSLERYDALWVMGGPMDVWEEDQHPWLIAEKQAIGEWVEVRAKPYFGLCLGHQLLGAATGGHVGKMPKPEVGVLAVDLNDAGRRDPIFAGIAPSFHALQWHGAAVLKNPPNATVLAASPVCANQAMRVGDTAYGLQCHVELTPSTVKEWGAVPTYACALDDTLGKGALPKLDAEATSRMQDFTANSRKLYDNFMGLMRRRRAA